MPTNFTAKTKRLSAVLASTLTILCLCISISGAASATPPYINQAVDYDIAGGSPSSGGYVGSMSQDGRYVAFESIANDIVSGANNSKYHIYVRDRQTNSTTLVSQSTSGALGDGYSTNPTISADWIYVVFESMATNLVSGDTGGNLDVFIRDIKNSTTVRVSTNVSGNGANGWSQQADVSSDGQFVVFASDATNLVSSPVTSTSDNRIYQKNMKTGLVQLISQSASGSLANSSSYYPVMSCEGRFIAYQSWANNLVEGDSYNPTKSKFRVYIVDMMSGISPSAINITSNGELVEPKMSCNGSYVSFTSTSTDLISGGTSSGLNVFVYNRITSTIELVSKNSAGSEQNSITVNPTAVSDDGKYISFASDATNLIPGVGGANQHQVYLHNLNTDTTDVLSKNSAGSLAYAQNIPTNMSADGKYVTFHTSTTSNILISGFTGSLYVGRSGASYDY